jgi:hypothetical protein
LGATPYKISATIKKEDKREKNKDAFIASVRMAPGYPALVVLGQSELPQNGCF